MPHHIVDDLYQIGKSVTGRDGWCEAVRVHVLLNEGRPLIFDSGSHLHTGEIIADLKALIGDNAPAHVFLTHTELPHTGNIDAILKEWPDTTLVVSSGILPHVELPWWVREDQVGFGYAGTLGTYAGREIAFLDGILKDQPGTHWMFDPRTGTLFSADAFGYYFPEEADDRFDHQIEGGVPQAWIHSYHEAAFRFLPMVLGDRVNADFDRLFTKRDVRVLAPTHGNAVIGDVPRFIEKFKTSITEICR